MLIYRLSVLLFLRETDKIPAYIIFFANSKPIKIESDVFLLLQSIKSFVRKNVKFIYYKYL